MMVNSRRWLWAGVVLFSLGLVGGLYFAWQVFQNKAQGIFLSYGVTDTLIRSFQSFNCPWALMPGETGVATVVLPYPTLKNSIKATANRLVITPVMSPASDPNKLQWEITAQGGGSGILLLEAPADLAPSEKYLYWGSMYRQGCSVLVSVLGLPYLAYLLLCLLLTAAGLWVVTRWLRNRRKKLPQLAR